MFWTAAMEVKVATLTLKQVPESLLEELRQLAERERRSINQQAIYCLEEAVKARGPSFSEKLAEFYATTGVLRDDEENALEDLRPRDPGRIVEP